MIRSRPRARAILLALLVTLLWSSSWVLIKFGFKHHLPPLTFAGLRYSLAFIALLPFLMRRKTFLSLKELRRRDWLTLALLGIVFYALTQGSMFISLSFLPANTLSLLLNLTTLFVGLAGIWTINERPLVTQWAGILLSSIGAVVFFLSDHLQVVQWMGLAAGIFCMLMNVVSALFSRSVNRTAAIPPFTVTFVSMGVGAGVLLAVGLIFQGSGEMQLSDWLIILWMAVINTALAFTLWNSTLQVLSAVESSIINSLMLPQIALLAFLFLGERLAWQGYAGLLLVFLGTLIVQIRLPITSKIKT